MAIKACRDCGGHVSTSARRCPHCGCGFPDSSLNRAYFLAMLYKAIDVAALISIVALGVHYGG